MRVILILSALIASVALGQGAIEPNSSAPEMPVGSDAGWSPTEKEYVYKYELPEPVGNVEMRFSRRVGSAIEFDGYIKFRDRPEIQFPGGLLECLRRLLLSEVHFNTVYVIPDSVEQDWFEEFWARITIPYNGIRDWDLESESVTVSLYPQIQIDMVGGQVTRIVFASSGRERKVLEPVPESVQCSDIDALS